MIGVDLRSIPQYIEVPFHQMVRPDESFVYRRYSLLSTQWSVTKGLIRSYYFYYVPGVLFAFTVRRYR